MKKLDRIERVVSHQSKSLLFINYPHRRVSKIERNCYMYIYRVSTCKYTKRSHHLLRRPKLDFKEIPRRFRTEDYVARQTCLEWIHGRGKYRNLDIYAGLYFDLFGSRDFSLRSRRGEAACNDIYIYIQGCQVGQTKYRISDTMVADAASITPSPALPSPARRRLSS